MKNNKDGIILMNVIKYGRIILYTMIYYLIQHYLGTPFSIAFIFIVLLSELWDLQMAAISIEDKLQEKEADDIGAIIRRAKATSKR